MSETRLWFVTDLRGASRSFRKVLNVALRRTRKKPDIIVISGNLTGRDVALISTTSDGLNSLVFRGETQTFQSHELPSRLRDIEDLGGYAVSAATATQPTADDVTAQLDHLRLQRLREWVSLAERTLARTRGTARFIVTPGPDDPPGSEAILKSSSVLEYSDDTVVALDSHLTMLCMGTLSWEMGRVLPAPPARLYASGREFRNAVRELMSSVPNPRQCIFNVHVPPYRTALDQCIKRDAQGLPVQGAFGLEFVNVGSPDVADCLREHRPLVSLHGFADEPYCHERVADTLAFNPGSEAFEGIVRGVWLAFKDGSLTKEWGLTHERTKADRLGFVMEQVQKAVRVGLLKKPTEVSEVIADTVVGLRDDGTKGH